MDEKERTFYDKFKDVVNAYVFHDPNAQASAAFDRERRMKSVDERTLAMFRESAEAGHPFSCFNLGRCYENGMGVEKDLGKAYEWYRKAATGGDVNAWLALGKMFDTGIYVDRDPKEAAMWLERAADKGHPIAMIGLGRKYAQGDGVEKDPSRALSSFRNAYELDKRIGSYVLGEAVGDGIGCEKDYKKAYELFEESHANHFPQGTYNVGMMLEMGLGCDKDEKRGFDLIKQAADEGVPEAMYRIAFHYREGTAPDGEDQKTAFEYFKKAADIGFAPACVETGLSYENGAGVEVSKEEAFRYYEKGADMGLHTAIVCLAVCYRVGIGCEIDIDRSIALLEQAVLIGNTRAYHLLAGALLEEDPYDERAINLEMVAARSGFARSALFLGGYFIQKSEVGPDLKRAEHYYRLAVNEGDATAAFELADLLDTDENREDPKTREEIFRLYRMSADRSNHPLAAYRTAMALRSGAFPEEKDEDRARKEIRYLSMASAGGVAEAGQEIAERCFWGDKMRVDLRSACALYHYTAEELQSDELMARYAFSQICIYAERLIHSIGRQNKIAAGNPDQEREGLLKLPQMAEMMDLLNSLASKDVGPAILFLAASRALVYGSDMTKEEDKALLDRIEAMPGSREKNYVLGIISGLIHKDRPQETIALLQEAKDSLQADNVNYILGNLYFSLTYGDRSKRRLDIPVLSEGTGSKFDPVLRLFSGGKAASKTDQASAVSSNLIHKKHKTKIDFLNTARAYYLEAYSIGETNTAAMYDLCGSFMTNLVKESLERKLAVLELILLPLIFFGIFLSRGGKMSLNEAGNLVLWIILIELIVYMSIVLIFDAAAGIRTLIDRHKEKKSKK